MDLRNKCLLKIVFFGTFLFHISCVSEVKNETDVTVEKVYSQSEKEEITDSVMEKAGQFGLNSQERRAVLDSAISAYPGIAYFYQQRAMPLYKQDKDELGLPFLEKAATLDPEKYLDYMAFMKCIFSQQYRSAITDFEKVLELSGEAYVMDHTYYFYMGISYLQLNEFEEAKMYLEKSVAQIEAESGREWVHFLDLMYLGISKMELGDYVSAIASFDEALEKYPSFGDVKYYKSICLFYEGETEAAKKMFSEAKNDIASGNTINEDNVYYERYPYQVRRGWVGLD